MSDSISESSESPNKWSPDKDYHFSLDKPHVSSALAEVAAGNSPLDAALHRFRAHVQATLARLLTSDWAPQPGYVYSDRLISGYLCVYRILPMAEDWDTVNSIDRLNDVYRKMTKKTVVWIDGFGCGNNTRSISRQSNPYDRLRPQELRHGLEIIVKKDTDPELIQKEMADFMDWADEHIAGMQYGWTLYKSMKKFDRAVRIPKAYNDKRYSTTNYVARKYAKRTLLHGGFVLLRQDQWCAFDTCVLACSFGNLFHAFFHGFDLWFKKGRRYMMICVKKQTIEMAIKFFKRARRSSARQRNSTNQQLFN